MPQAYPAGHPLVPRFRDIASLVPLRGTGQKFAEILGFRFSFRSAKFVVGFRVDMSTQKDVTMAKAKGTLRRVRAGQGESKIIGFRLPVKVAEAVKVEAVRRNLALNALLVEMWELYRKKKREV